MSGEQQLLARAMEAFGRGALDDAERHLEALLASRPDHAEGHQALGMVRFERGDWRAGAACLERAVELVPDAAMFHLNLGAMFEHGGDRARAASAFERAAELEPRAADAHFNLGLARLGLGEAAAAAASLERAAELEPRDPFVRYNLGRALEALGERDAAITAYAQSLRLHPELVDATRAIARALRAAGQAHQAEQWCRKALARRPRDPAVLVSLADALRDLGELAEARKHYADARTLAPEVGAIALRLGAVCRDLGDIDAAVDAFRQARRDPSLEGEALSGLASALRHSRATRHAPAIESDLLACLEHPSVDHQSLARAAASQVLARHPRVGVEGDGLSPELVRALAADPLLRALLIRCINVDPALERVVSRLRGALLDIAIRSGDWGEHELACACAIGMQMHANEYVVTPDPGELDALAASSGALAGSRRLACAAMYGALDDDAVRDAVHDAGEYEALPEAVRHLVDMAVARPREERELAVTIDSLTPVRDTVSREVRGQYEDNPYPRWTQVPAPGRGNLGEHLARRFSRPERTTSPEHPLRTLVAGCGTGFEPISIASRHADVDVLALDLSRASLAHALANARRLEVERVRFVHGDILELDAGIGRFDLIVSSGVLHHMANPLDGWRRLRERLAPGGIMRIGLYSALARRAVSEARARIAARNLRPVPHHIRTVRDEIVHHPKLWWEKELARSDDIYSASGCRDLLFHVQEHCFTLAGIEQALVSLDLEFLGFELADARIGRAFNRENPAPEAARDLAAWAGFESRHPDAFVGMYELWCAPRV